MPTNAENRPEWIAYITRRFDSVVDKYLAKDYVLLSLEQAEGDEDERKPYLTAHVRKGRVTLKLEISLWVGVVKTTQV